MVTQSLLFPPTKKAFLERLDAVEIHPYEVSRNALTGSVTYLSPYISHGYANITQIIQTLKMKKGLQTQHKLFAELGWREFFQHVWSHLGDQIFADIRPALPNVIYATEIPEDILEAKTGIPTIDRCVQELYRYGYVHNHARMWLASYLIHFRKIHWLSGANWFYSHLLDGDLASNHLSWQWVGATFSHKPYIFNAENGAKYAPKDWHCFNTPLNASYAELEKLARSKAWIEPSPTIPLLGETQPPVFSSPPLSVLKDSPLLNLPSALIQSSRTISFIHPWDLSSRVDNSFRVGVIYLPFHQMYPWSLLRWQFVLERMASICDYIWIGEHSTNLYETLKTSEKSLRIQHTRNPHYLNWIKEMENLFRIDVTEIETYFENPAILCPSFSKFWQQVTSKGSFPLP
jgi:deoxyribodipyrimidine photo-lyase